MLRLLLVLGGVAVLCGIVLVVIVIVGAMALKTSRADSAREMDTTMTSAAVDTLDVQFVEAAELAQAYDENEIAADLRFKGHTVVVSGTIAELGTEILGAPYLMVGTTQPAIQAGFPRSAVHTLAQRRKGEMIRVHCQVSGKLVHIILRDCAVF